MTLNSLDKILDRYEQQFGFTTVPNQFELLQGLPFYNWSVSPAQLKIEGLNTRKGIKQEFGRITTFNDAIGLPQKNGQPMPLFDYEQLLFNVLQNHKHLWIKKATGLGITEFVLRYMAWLCFDRREIFGAGSQMCIVTGPRIELAITLIDRMKELFRNYSLNSDRQNVKFDSHRT